MGRTYQDREEPGAKWSLGGEGLNEVTRPVFVLK